MSLIKKAVSFVQEVNTELGKVVWPSRAELVGSSIIVCILAVFFAIVLGGMDAGFSTLVKRIIG